MRITSIEIQNYKCFQKTILSINPDFHTFIGPNSSGKTSLIEGCKLWRNLRNGISDPEIVYGGINEDFNHNLVEIAFVIESSEEERSHYLSKYFHFSWESIQRLTKTSTLKRIKMSLGIVVRKKRKEPHDNVVILTETAILDADGNNFIPILKLDNDRKNVTISQFELESDISNN